MKLELKDKMNRKYITIILVLLLVVITAVVVIRVTHDPLDDFSGPTYIPANFHIARNNTTENSTYLLYQGSSRLDVFVVGAIRDQNKTVINNIQSSFNNTTSQDANLLFYEEKLNITGHTVTVRREEINFFGTLISFFETSWYCENTKLTFIASGVVPSSEIPEINKMLESIKCHKTSFF